MRTAAAQAASVEAARVPARPPLPTWLTGVPGDWVLSIQAQPGASRCAVAGEHGDCLRVRIAAPPIDGRANDTLRAYIAERLGVPRSAVLVEHGEASRRKRVRVTAGCEAAAVVAGLAPD
jgi:uncharacterized protein (TIGR00251 family)